MHKWWDYSHSDYSGVEELKEMNRYQEEMARQHDPFEDIGWVDFDPDDYDPFAMYANLEEFLAGG